MEVSVRKMLVMLFLFFIGTFVVVVSPVRAWVLIWDEYVLGTGGEVVSPVLENETLYRIVADEVWWYDDEFNNLAADAQYYTTDPSNSWIWGNYFPAPGGHSFLQINGTDVNWGDFSNGDTGHTYNIFRYGEGVPLSFEIIDWMDGNYTNNDCKIRVRIYESVTVGGYVVDSDQTGMVALPLIGLVVAALLITVPVVWRSRKAES